MIFCLFRIRNCHVKRLDFCVFSLQYKLFFLIFVFRGDLKGNSLFFRQKLDFLLKEHGGHASGKREEDSVCEVRWLAVISVFDVGISG